MAHDITALRQQRGTLYEQFSAIQAAAEAESRAMTEDEQSRFDALATDIEGMDRRIRSAEEAQRLRAETAIPGPGHGDEDPAANGLRAEPQPRDPAPAPGIRFAQMTRALIAGHGRQDAAIAFAAATWGERHEVTAALQQNDMESGGALVPERFTAELIDLLRPQTVIRANARTMPLVGGTDTMPAVEEGTAAFYIGEGDDIQTTEPRFGALKFVEREIAALVPISNKLLRNASVAVDAWIRDELVRSFALTEDLAFLRGNGGGPGPRGIRFFAPAENVIPANATVNLTNIDTDARSAELALLHANTPMMNTRWIMSPRSFTFLRDLRDGNGNHVYPGLSTPVPIWKGYPVSTTNQVPRNLGGGSDESEVYLVDFTFAVIADSYRIRIDASETAAYKQGAEMISAYSRNQTVIRALAGHDFGMTRPAAAAVLTEVKWGA